MLKVNLTNLQDTATVAKHLAAELHGGEVFFLNGDLGVGKTAFVKFFGQAFGIDARIISSPTFTYFNLYETTLGRPQIFHADLYRLEHYESLHNIGFWDYCEQSNFVAFIEWASKFKQLNQLEHIELSLEFTHEREQRVLLMSAKGVKYRKILEKIKNALSDYGLNIL
ncbi:tRNA (adenosine(37)-N6)-threonylcarbamoyltransferase complex ATPase subunit type 1 TsaE [bacterium]|nr:tRNA (adenosine(37)-N6)-threonylcarbamoyltransferase complex ATPase subunit type 1 TsaE [bacterium]